MAAKATDNQHPDQQLRRDRRFQVSRAAIEALVRSILAPGNFLGIKTVAGFVEDAETLAKLSEMGVDCVQGTLIGELQPLARLG